MYEQIFKYCSIYNVLNISNYECTLFFISENNIYY